ncbi:MAG: phosphodiesterase [Trebonia sp.]
MLVFAQISDTHLDGGERRGSRAAAVMAYLGSLSAPLAAVLVTGDITDHGLPAEYEQARAILSSPSHPVLHCPGNHDARNAYREVLLGEDNVEAGGGPVNRVHVTGGAAFVLCDSTLPGQDGGYLADETLTWLDQVLSEHAELPAFVCFHHPPVLVHCPSVDGINQSGGHRLARIIGRHPHVAAILCGHAHLSAATTFAGRPLLVAPGVASTLALPWERGDALDEHAPAGVALHVLDNQWRLTTHYRVVRT